ncbi:sulfatase-like hydrolase/transferase [bacterium]|nr:sulfatase-like hydrolase/transferase [candidate division CSSED10-310 bacterium]
MKRYIGFVLLFSTFLAACGEPLESPIASPPPPSYNVLLITLDTLRADYLGGYGRAGAGTPVIDQLSREGVTCTQAITSSPLTTPSHSTMMTGLHPREHRVIRNGMHLPREVITLAELLSTGGYHTCAISNISAGDPAGNGLSQGFETYLETIRLHETVGISVETGNTQATGIEPTPTHVAASASKMSYYILGAEQISQRGIGWLEEHQHAPFFMWLHYFEPHQPYAPSQRYFDMFAREINPRRRFYLTEDFLRIHAEKILLDRLEVEYVKRLYAGEVAYTDYAVGLVLETLRRLGLMKNTLVVVTADHGEVMYEKDHYFGHAGVVHEGVLQVPLLLRLPGVLPEGVLVSRQVRLLDLTPTVLDILGYQAPQRMRGESRRDILTGGVPPRGEEDDVPVFTDTGEELISIRLNGWKAVADQRGKIRDLYDLTSDPAETHNLTTRERSMVRKLTSRIRAWRNDMEEIKEQALMVNEEEMAQLRELGYIN